MKKQDYIQFLKRTELLIGKEKIQKLQQAKVAVFGLGGVGSYVVEGLARSGIGSFTLIDFDKVDVTNINRQIIANINTIEKYKVDIEEQRIHEINPNAIVEKYIEFIEKESIELNQEGNIKENNNISLFNNIKNVDYIVDAVDTVSAKIRIIEFAKNNNIPVISALGTGNKLDPTKLKIGDIYDTSVCPLAKVMRKELRKRNIQELNVVYSIEEPIKIQQDIEERKLIGSISYLPSIAGLMISYKVINDIVKK